jgi:hypothetical protein
MPKSPFEIEVKMEIGLLNFRGRARTLLNSIHHICASVHLQADRT